VTPRLFVPPVFSSPEQTDRAATFHTIAVSAVVVITVSVAAVIALLPPAVPRGLVIIGGVVVLNLSLLVLNRSGRTRLASWLLVIGLLTITSSLAITAGGIRAPSVVVNIVIVMMAGILLGEGAGLIVGASCVLIGLAFVVVEANGMLPALRVQHTTSTIRLLNSLCIGLAISLQRLAARAVRKSMTRASRAVSAQQDAQEALRATAVRLQLALQAGSIGVWDLDLTTGRLTGDSRFFALFGLPEETRELPSTRQTWDRLHPDDKPAVEGLVSELRKVGGQFRTDYRVVLPNGTERWILSEALAVSESSGPPTRVVGMNVDITDTRNAQREREKLVHDLGERVKELRLLHAATRLLQQDRPITRSLLAALVAMMPEAWQYPDNCEARITFDGMEVTTPGWRPSMWGQQATFRTSRGDGVIEVIYREARPAADEGPFLAEERSLLHSLTELIEAHVDRRLATEALSRREAEMRAIFEHAAVGIALIDERRHAVSSNPALERFLGYSRDELAARPLREFLHEGAAAGHDLMYRSLLDGTRDHFQLEHRFVRRDGERVWGRMTVSLLGGRGEDGAIAVGLIEDITAEKTAERERRSLEGQLRQSQKMEALGTLAGGIAHDFNNILTAIGGNAELALQELGEGDPARRSVEEILRAGSRAADLVRRILLFSRKQETQRRVVAPVEVVEEALGLLRTSLPPGIRLITNYGAYVPLILADATQIHQIIMNLGTNAIHALGGGHGTLTVSVQRVMLDGDPLGEIPELKAGPYVSIEVHDTGRGMNSELLERIFEPFFTTKGPDQGTGLGLSVVHGIVRSHGGAVRVESTTNVGTSFRLFFPMADEEVAARASAWGEKPSGSGQRIMYVDDEDAIVFAMTRILDRIGYRGIGFSDTHQALQAFREDPFGFDAVITDLAMPSMTGIEFARAVLRIRPDARIALSSGYASYDADSIRAVGIYIVIPKPASIAQIRIAMRELIEGSPLR